MSYQSSDPWTEKERAKASGNVYTFDDPSTTHAEEAIRTALEGSVMGLPPTPRLTSKTTIQI